MRYIKEYNTFLLHKNKNEDYIVDYILGINESYSINESIISRLKDVTKKGLLTLTLLTSMLSSDAFAQQYNNLDNQQKKEIINTISTDKLSIDIATDFKSGQWKIDESNKDDITKKLQVLIDFTKKYKKHQISILIESSESKVPNKDVETKKRLKPGELAELRFNSAKKLIENLLPNIQIKKNITVSGPDWKGDDPNKDEYKKHQFIKITAFVNTQKCDLCDKLLNYDGSLAGKSSKFTGYEYKTNVTNIESAGSVVLEPGSIPDRAILYIDGVKIGDTGYFSDRKHQYVDFKLVPLYVKELTELRLRNKNSEAFKDVKTVNVKSIEELNEILFVNPNFEIKKNLGDEINEPYKILVKMVEKSGEEGLDLVIYETSPKKIDFKVDDNDNFLVKVFSPVSKTGFNGYIDCEYKKIKD
jgi:hypothetical protein